jgi:prepilin-type N-terminal cleavage/methylation domain-containing protein
MRDMRCRGRIRNSAGFTLIELTVAIAIFAIVLGTAAQALVSYHATIHLQHQRNVATQNCKAILSQMRNVRNQAGAQFPNIITGTWADGQPVEGAGTMRGEQVVVTYTDVNANPLEVTVRSTFPDMRGRQVTTQISTRLTDV